VGCGRWPGVLWGNHFYLLLEVLAWVEV